jgi:hypothetical protein
MTLAMKEIPLSARIADARKMTNAQRRSNRGKKIDFGGTIGMFQGIRWRGMSGAAIPFRHQRIDSPLRAQSRWNHPNLAFFCELQ